MNSREKVLSVWPKCVCGGVAVSNASGDITRTCIRCGAIVRAASKLPSAPSPAGTGHVVKNKSTAAGREFWGHVEAIAKQVRNPKWVPEPVTTEEAQQRFLRAANTRCCDEWPECSHILAAYEEMVDAKVAAPSAPAAVSEDSYRTTWEHWNMVHPENPCATDWAELEDDQRERWIQTIEMVRAQPSAEGDGWIAVTDADREETNGDCVGWECITDIEQLRKVLCVVSDERYAAIRQLKEKSHE